MYVSEYMFINFMNITYYILYYNFLWLLQKYGRQPWHKKEISTYEHRHAAQKKILEEQKRQIMEQQRLIEDLQFKVY